MRLGINPPHEALEPLGRRSEAIKGSFLAGMGPLTEMAETKVMLGDATVTSQKTFDPGRVEERFRGIVSGLEGWDAREVSTTRDEGMGRTFARMEAGAGSYVLSAHLAVQFHVLLYYKPVQRVVDCQKELASVISATKDGQQQMSDAGDQAVLDRLRELGYKDFDHQKLFETFYENDELREEIYAGIERDSGDRFRRMEEEKSRLLGELDSLLVETYQTTPVMIDEARLATGEEGLVCSVDLEIARGGSRSGTLDPGKIPGRVLGELGELLGSLEGAVGRAP